MRSVPSRIVPATYSLMEPRPRARWLLKWGPVTMWALLSVLYFVLQEWALAGFTVSVALIMGVTVHGVERAFRLGVVNGVDMSLRALSAQGKPRPEWSLDAHESRINAELATLPDYYSFLSRDRLRVAPTTSPTRA